MSRRTIDPDVEDEVRARLALGDSPTRALDRLSREPEYADRLPSLRTVERMRASFRPGERWSFAAADPDEARFVLPVMAALGANALSRETAGWIAKVRRAAPALSAEDAFRWAIRYQAARDPAKLDERFAREVTR